MSAVINSFIHELQGFKHGQVPGEAQQRELTDALESGAAIALPGFDFPMSDAEKALLDPRILSKAKNVSYSPATERSGGTSCTGDEARVLQQVMARYSSTARDLVASLFPSYREKLRVMRTSLRPAEIEGRRSSWRKDDTLLHVDAFPSQPTSGNRILRVFCNVNPHGKPRVWRLGEAFESVARRFCPGIGRPFPGSAQVLRLLGITKSVRSEYDYIMLKLHDAMKADAEYQRTVGQTPVLFQPGTVWTCYADSVSHAALSGQHQFEQTIYVPLGAMLDVNKSPLRILERLRGRALA